MDDKRVDAAWWDFADAYGLDVDELEYSPQQKYNMLLREFKHDVRALERYLKGC